MKRLFVFTAVLGIAAVGAIAYGERIASVETKGIFVKDNIFVDAFDDPDLKGVVCYITYYSKAMSMVDPSDTSIACVKTGPVSGEPGNKAGVFSQQKSPIFKSTVVDRFYDANRKVVLYLAYTTDTGGKNAAHAMSAVPLQ